MRKHWKEFPPTHVCLTSLLKGLGGKSSSGASTENKTTNADWEYLISLAKQSDGVITG